MAEQKKWDGKSKGNWLGYQFFIVMIRWFGVAFAYFFLDVVTYYYYLFSPTKKHLLYLYQNQLGFSPAKSKKIARQNYKLFGQTLVDRFAFAMGKIQRYTHHSVGGENLKMLSESKQGAILMSAHIGNWELAGNFLKKNYNNTVNALMYQADAEKLRALFEQVTNGVDFNIIAIKNDLEHIIKIHQALKRGEFICLHTDRHLPNAKTVEVNFLGKKAKFPLAPFQMAAKFKVPIAFVYNIKSEKYHYTLSSTKAMVGLSAEELLYKYVEVLEEKCKKNPAQWFNFYDFYA